MSKKFVMVEFWNCRGERGSKRNILEGPNMKEAIIHHILKDMDSEDIEGIRQEMERDDVTGIEPGEYLFNRVGIDNEGWKMETINNIQFMWLEGDEDIQVVVEDPKDLHMAIGWLVVEQEMVIW